MTYSLTLKDRPLIIEGDNLKDAIENNFAAIIDATDVKNTAGYILTRVWVDTDGLHVIASGSDALADFDPTTDKPREFVFRIADLHGTTVPFEIEIEPARKFDPFAPEIMNYTDGQKFGIILGLAEEIATHHCKEPRAYAALDAAITAYEYKPEFLYNQVLQILTTHRIKDSKQAANIMARIHELRASITSFKRDAGATIVEKWHVKKYFDDLNTVTALEYYRKRKDMTQTQLAEAIGCTRSQIARYEGGANLGDAKYVFVCRLAEVLDCRADDLVCGGVNANAPANSN